MQQCITYRSPTLYIPRTCLIHLFLKEHPICSFKIAVLGAHTGFALVGGLRPVISELREAVQLPLQDPEAYRRLGVAPPRGVLLYGPPGTGKTLLARALASELRCPVELLAATDLVGGLMGDAEERIKAAFERCQRLAEQRRTGCLLFIDEIDAILPKREEAGEQETRGELGRTLLWPLNT